uniref:Uncharacterized protein n=1 Tax=Rhizophora mucronata TaxID=61149 RepID=A0A2P2PPK9_RHIMU
MPKQMQTPFFQFISYRCYTYFIVNILISYLDLSRMNTNPLKYFLYSFFKYIVFSQLNNH